jgi:hypothetical protein
VGSHAIAAVGVIPAQKKTGAAIFLSFVVVVVFGLVVAEKA